MMSVIKNKVLFVLQQSSNRSVQTSSIRLFDPYDSQEAEKRKKKKVSFRDAGTSLVKQTHFFDQIPVDSKNQEAFEKAISMFRERNVHLRGHVDFIFAALKRMKEFGVHENLEVYRQLVDLFPKGKMVARNIIQADIMFYPRHQDCCKQLLDQMGYYGVHIDKAFYKLVESVFGNASSAMLKVKYMLYWMPKFKHANPNPVPNPLPNSELELAKIIMNRICRDPANIVTTFFSESLPDAKEDTWLVSGQSSLQQDHLRKHPKNQAIYVDGPFRAWAVKKSLNYFMLCAEPEKNKFYADLLDENHNLHTPEEWANLDNKYTTEYSESRRKLILTPTIHEQSDGTILALVITGSSSKESLAYWLRFLQEYNPSLKEIPVVFRISSPTGELVTLEGSERFYATKNMMQAAESQ
uniref:Evolutionarily conserved signaling intermediate in Toll pathway, mitochondrial n=1 Tax=Romanomermis culicivorax TaxID=13658 RepID=A0A915I2R5_ROMCU